MTTSVDPLVKKALSRLKALKEHRRNWDDHWQEIADYEYPQRADFTVNRAPGERRMTRVYDTTAIQAAELLASGFHGMLTNPATNWASLLMADPELNKDEDVKKWLREVRDIMFEEINDPQAGFSTSLHEVYMDYGTFCTAVLFVTDRKGRDGIQFNSRSLTECYIAENASGEVDTLYRVWKWTVRQLLDVWPSEDFSDKVQKLIEKGKLDEYITILHVIEPRTERDISKKDVTNLPFASTYFELDNKHVIQNTGYHEKPFMAPRFAKSTSGEVYGRGPGVTVLPDVKMLNAMMKTTLKAAQKKVDPVLNVEDDSVIGILKAVPAGINYYRRGSNPPAPMDTRGDIRLGEEMMQSVRARIREAFFVDQLQLQQGPQMTATEVMQRTEEKLRLMGPVLGRLQTELLGPMIDRIFGILYRQGKFPDVPAALQSNQKIKIEYESPISRAQKQLEATGILRTFDIMNVLIQADPSVMDNFDGDKAFKHIGVDLFGVDPALYRDKRDVQSLRDQRSQTNQQQLMLDQQQKAANIRATNANAEAASAKQVKVG